MQGQNSIVVYYDTTITKTIISDELEEPLEIAAAREVHMMVKSRAGYPYIPQFISLTGRNITMERIYGIKLLDYIKNSPTLDTYRNIVKKVEYAIKSILEAGVYNKDITPENIIVSPDGHIWIIDFGIAEQLCSNDDPKEFVEENMSLFLRSFNYILAESRLEYLIS